MGARAGLRFQPNMEVPLEFTIHYPRPGGGDAPVAAVAGPH